MTNCKAFVAVALAAAMAMGAAAQDTFDLASQRKEVQRFNRVPGHKVDHKGIIINPTPQSLILQGTDVLDFGQAKGFAIDNKAYMSDVARIGLPLSPRGPKVRISVGEKSSLKQGVEQKKGAYKLTVGKKDISIAAFDDAGAFYALQTLRQLVESPMAKNGSLPCLTIADYPDMPYRGVVEGFYGTPWSHQVRLSLIEFYGRNKMNDYIYGPKDDPYHSSPNWRLPYPPDEAKQIKELVEACKANRVNFVWAIHPGKDIRWNKADYDSLVGKLNMMYDLGVRSFALFFDDIEGIGTDSNKQAELVNDLTRDFVKTKGDVTNLMICPTDYSQSWANPRENGQLAIYGRKLNPDVEVFWTGAAVCSDLTPSTLEFINSRIKRPALFWWNFPVSDYCRNYLLQGPSYGLDTTLTSAQVAGVESNPMEHGEASKLALYGVADYTWNSHDYNPMDNWERALVEVAPEDPEAYRTFAIHSADTETGYRRDESWETETFEYNNYTPQQFEALADEFRRIQTVPARMEKTSNKQLLNELRPWLTQFGLLGQRGERTLELIKVYESGNDSAFWAAYTANIMTPEQLEAYDAHKSGTMKLQPFYNNAMDQMLAAFYAKVANRAPATRVPVSSYRNIGAPAAKLMLDNDTTTFYTSAYGQRTGDWIGLDLGAVRPVDHVIIRQGRNSVDDVDYFDATILEASANGRDWTPLTDSLANTYDITWTGDPVDARYVRIRKLPSSKQNWAAIRIFQVNPMTPERLGFDIKATDMTNALRAFDDDPTTTFISPDNLTFGRPTGTNGCTLMLNSLGKGVKFVQYDAAGRVIESRNITSPFTRISFSPQASRLSLDGPAEIHEIIMQ